MRGHELEKAGNLAGISIFWANSTKMPRTRLNQCKLMYIVPVGFDNLVLGTRLDSHFMQNLDKKQVFF